MTPSRARGRPRSEERRDAVLTAAMELMQEDDLRRASVDRIAATQRGQQGDHLQMVAEQNRGGYRRVSASNDG